jgi:glycosyltransferase involved in cell wall biosynthesis
VRAAAIVGGQRQDVEFIIAGRDNSNDGKYGRELKQLIEANGLSERTQIIEERIDVAEFLAQLDLFVSASHSEAFGLAIVEAMAAGVPVVATATEGASEIIADRKTGRLVPIGDIQQMANTVSEMLSDPEERERLCGAARQAVTEKLAIDSMITETEGVYRGVLAK